MGRLSRLAALAGVAALVATPGCGGGGDGSGGDGERAQARPDATTTTPSASRKREAPTQTVAPSHCPPGHPSCRSTEGRIVYVERVDPDGDGDAHFVVVDPQGITLPELTAIDVRKGLRPHPLPGPGDLISAAGPVQTGSYGQHQIHALELHVAGR
jgi:hypothetical protein